MENWRWYITDLERRYITMKGKAQLTRMDEKGEPASPTADIRIEDPQEIQVLQDKCNQLAHVLGMDSVVLGEIGNHFLSSSPVEEFDESADVQSSLRSLLQEANSHVKRVENLLRRLDGTITLMRTMLDFRSLASLQHSTRMMTTLTRLSQHENFKIKELTQKATKDTEIMKWITLLTLVYLPASFVSSMMGMDYIRVPSGPGFSIQFKGEFWVFFVLTVILLLFTFAIYFWYIRRNRKLEKNTANMYMERERTWSALVDA